MSAADTEQTVWKQPEKNIQWWAREFAFLWSSIRLGQNADRGQVALVLANMIFAEHILTGGTRKGVSLFAGDLFWKELIHYGAPQVPGEDSLVFPAQNDKRERLDGSEWILRHVMQSAIYALD